MNSGVLIHITNKNEYFVGDRKRVMNKCVKVGGEKKILVDSMGKAMIEINNKKLIL